MTPQALSSADKSEGEIPTTYRRESGILIVEPLFALCRPLCLLADNQERGHDIEFGNGDDFEMRLITECHQLRCVNDDSFTHTPMRVITQTWH